MDTGINPPKSVLKKIVRKGLEQKAQVLFVFAGSTEWAIDNELQIKALTEILNIRLRQIVREDEGGTYNIWAYGDLRRYPDEEYMMYIGFGSAPEKAEKLSLIVLKEMERFKKNGPSEVEMGKVREILNREHETNIKKNSFWLHSLKTNYLHELPPERILTIPFHVDMLDSETIRKAALVYLELSNYSHFILLPE